MIDTPNKEGIDKENLIKNIGLLAEADKYTEEMKTQYQIILTTGIDTYPEEFKKNVFTSWQAKIIYYRRIARNRKPKQTDLLYADSLSFV